MTNMFMTHVNNKLTWLHKQRIAPLIMDTMHMAWLMTRTNMEVITGQSKNMQGASSQIHFNGWVYRPCFSFFRSFHLSSQSVPFPSPP